VKSLISRRVGADLARTHYEDQSPVREKVKDTSIATRDRGAGRPTKRDRRLIDRLRGY
jgi:ribosome-associated heat shock protein Hsp15